MKPARKIRIILSLIIFISLSCRNNQDIEVEKLAKVYVDLQVISDTYHDTDSLTLKRQEIFNKYSISEEIYDSTFKNFSYDKDKWEEFFNLANTYLDTLKADLIRSEKKE